MSRLSLVLLVAMLSVTPVAAAQCPAHNREETLTLLGRAGSCAAAIRLLEACAWGTGQDVEFASVAMSKCEPGIPSRMRKAYESAKQACRTKHGTERGTMYVSFAAICEAKSALKFSSGR